MPHGRFWSLIVGKSILVETVKSLIRTRSGTFILLHNNIKKCVLFSFSLITLLIQKKNNNKSSSEFNFRQGRLGPKNEKISNNREIVNKVEKTEKL